MRLLIALFACLLLYGLVAAQDVEIPLETVLERIERAQEQNSRYLLLYGVSEIPREIANLQNLESLVIVGNPLVLPPEIGQLSNLRTLEIRTGLSTLPPEIANLSALETLNLSNNRLEQIPPELFNLPNLKTLILAHNLLTELPDEINQLLPLEHLDLSNNRLGEFPTEILDIHSLKLLNLADNEIGSIPNNITELASLCLLNLSNNDLRETPSSLGQIQGFTEVIDCSGYRGGIVLDGNPLISPPQEVIAQGSPAILDYLRNEAWWHLQKLIMSGAAAIGGVSLLVLGLRWRNRRGKEKRKINH